MAGLKKRLAVGTMVRVRKSAEPDRYRGMIGVVEKDDRGPDKDLPYSVNFTEGIDRGRTMFFGKSELIVLKDTIEPDGTINHADGSKTIQVEMTDAQFLEIAKLAHAEDVTWNQFVNKLIVETVVGLL